MYDKDKRQRITVRVTDEQMDFIRSQTDVLGISPSDYLRMLVNSIMFVNKNGGVGLNSTQLIKETSGRENDESNRND